LHVEPRQLDGHPSEVLLLAHRALERAGVAQRRVPRLEALCVNRCRRTGTGARRHLLAPPQHAPLHSVVCNAPPLLRSSWRLAEPHAGRESRFFTLFRSQLHCPGLLDRQAQPFQPLACVQFTGGADAPVARWALWNRHRCRSCRDRHLPPCPRPIASPPPLVTETTLPPTPPVPYTIPCKPTYTLRVRGRVMNASSHAQRARWLR
jgi:hypothetical protein